MKSLDVEQILQDIISTEDRGSDDIKKLPSHNSFVNSISDNCSNDELEALQYLFEAMSGSIYEILSQRAEKEFSIRTDISKFDRKNHIKIQVRSHKVLKLSNGVKWFSGDVGNVENITIPFYKNKYETIEPIYKKLDEIYDKFEIVNKTEVEDSIEEYTGMKRKQ